jgi:cyclase
MFDGPHTRAMLEAFRRASARQNRHARQHPSERRSLVRQCARRNAEIIATERAASAMAHETPAMLEGFMKAAPGIGLTGEYLVHCFGRFNFADAPHKLPDTTFSGSLTKRVGSKAVDLIEVGPAHTGGDAIVWVESDRTVFTGDILFIEGHPIVWAGPSATGSRPAR